MFFIKDLKALENDTTRVSIDIKDLKDLRRHLDDGQRGGQAPALRKKTVLEPSRGTGPRATKKMSLQVRRTLMSIARANAKNPKVL